MYRHVLKRVFDILFSILAMPTFLVLFIIIAPLVKIEDRGPVFYIAPRLGYKGKIYRMIKFRSMVVNAPDLRNSDGTTYNSDDDPRLTRIGRVLRRTSMDETPQLINVILGHMSIVGPRPDLPRTMDKYSAFERRKLDVKPGITGYSQVMSRNACDLQQRYAEDVYYVDNLSLLLDIKILFTTILCVLSHKNVNRNTDIRETHIVKEQSITKEQKSI